MTVVASHAGTAPDAFDVVHRGQIVSFLPGRLAVDPLMRATIMASDADVAWDDDPEAGEPGGAVQEYALGILPRRRGRPPNRV